VNGESKVKYFKPSGKNQQRSSKQAQTIATKTLNKNQASKSLSDTQPIILNSPPSVDASSSDTSPTASPMKATASKQIGNGNRPLTVASTGADVPATKQSSKSKPTKTQKSLSSPDVPMTLDAAIKSIENSFGKGTVMKLSDSPAKADVISTGSLGLDWALGVGTANKLVNVQRLQAGFHVERLWRSMALVQIPLLL
jgi:hypothetical protein